MASIHRLDENTLLVSPTSAASLEPVELSAHELAAAYTYTLKRLNHLAERLREMGCRVTIAASIAIDGQPQRFRRLRTGDGFVPPPALEPRRKKRRKKKRSGKKKRRAKRSVQP